MRHRCCDNAARNWVSWKVLLGIQSCSLPDLYWILLYPMLQTFGLLMSSGLGKRIVHFREDCKCFSSH